MVFTRRKPACDRSHQESADHGALLAEFSGKSAGQVGGRPSPNHLQYLIQFNTFDVILLRDVDPIRISE